MTSLHQTDIASANSASGFCNAGNFGFSPDADAMDNVRALQKAVDQGGTVIVSRPGTYEVGGTVYIGSNTTLKFGNGVFLKKVDVQGLFTHVLLNKGAMTKTYDENIVVEGLHIVVNKIDKPMTEVYGLRGQIAFFYVKDLRIERFRCLDLTNMQFAIHICTFEDVIVNDVIIKGNKDGVHLGRGKRFTISNGIFQTYDDAIALNAQDYATSNPELGWIENGVVQNCYDLPDGKAVVGFFCRILAGGWIDWTAGMEVQHSDTVVSNGRLYRVQAQPDSTVYKSVTRPVHDHGRETLDGICWGVVQTDITYTAGVRYVVFRDIFLEKPRTGFSVHFDNSRYSRSYYPGAAMPVQKQILLDNVRILHDGDTPLVEINTPVDVLTVSNSSINNNRIVFRSNDAISDYLKTQINIIGCIFNYPAAMTLLENTVEGKKIVLKGAANIAVHDNFEAELQPGTGMLTAEGDFSHENISKL